METPTSQGIRLSLVPLRIHARTGSSGLSAPFCPLAFLLSPDQSEGWLVGAVGIEFWSIIPKPLYCQYLTDTHRKANRGQIEVKDSFGGSARLGFSLHAPRTWACLDATCTPLAHSRRGQRSR